VIIKKDKHSTTKKYGRKDRPITGKINSEKLNDGIKEMTIER
jgi:hypothetical protein